MNVGSAGRSVGAQCRHPLAAGGRGHAWQHGVMLTCAHSFCTKQAGWVELARRQKSTTIFPGFMPGWVA